MIRRTVMEGDRLCEKMWNVSTIKSELFLLKLKVKTPKLVNILNIIMPLTFLMCDPCVWNVRN